MKRQFLVAYIFFSLAANLSAGEKKYAYSDIPASLIADSKAVVRKYDAVFNISSLNSATQKVTYAITVLNKNAIDNSVLRIPYDRYLNVKNIEATVFDKEGNRVKINMHDSYKDIAAIDGYSLYNDIRIKVVDPRQTAVPFTVEYTYEIHFNGLMDYPDWNLYEDFNISIQDATFSVISPLDLELRYYERNIPVKCNKYLADGKRHYEWKVAGLLPLRDELYSPDRKEFCPEVMLAPAGFEIGGYTGNAESWKNFGLWINKLGEGRRKLPVETVKKINELASGAKTDTGRIRILYNYMQNKVRYVLVKEGMGGWQPISAEEVDRVSYGDCKALSNYMKAILDVAGIKSYYTLVRAGSKAPGIIEEFPSNQFNHAIICVPLEKDTIWLECTDQTIPFGFIGSFTDDRKVLVICESGGVLARSKKYPSEDNRQVRNITIRIHESGSAEASLATIYKGLKYDAVYSVLRMDDAEKERFIHARLNIPAYDLKSFSYTEFKTLIPELREELSISMSNYPVTNGRNYILRPDFTTLAVNIPGRTVQRKSPIRIARSSVESDSVTYIFERKITAELPWSDFTLSSPFGKYHASLSLIENKIFYVRTLELLRGDFPITSYNEFINFFEKISAEDNRQLIVRKM